MAEGKGKNKRKSSKLLLLGGALAAAAAAGAYLSDCIPGLEFGAGSGTDAPTKDADPAEKAEEEAADPNAPIAVTVDDTQCKRGDGELGDCDALCEELKTLEKPGDIIIDDAAGVHKTVVEFTDCLEAAGMTVRLAG